MKFSALIFELHLLQNVYLIKTLVKIFENLRSLYESGHKLNIQNDKIVFYINHISKLYFLKFRDLFYCDIITNEKSEPTMLSDVW